MALVQEIMNEKGIASEGWWECCKQHHKDYTLDCSPILSFARAIVSDTLIYLKIA